MWKWMGLFLRENHFLKCCSWLSLFLRLLCISINLPYDHTWNTLVMSGLVLLVVTQNCWINYKNGYAWLLVLHLLPLFEPLAHQQNVASLSLSYRYYFGRCSSELVSEQESVHLMDCVIFLLPFLNVAIVSMSTVSFPT